MEQARAWAPSQMRALLARFCSYFCPFHQKITSGFTNKRIYKIVRLVRTSPTSRRSAWEHHCGRPASLTQAGGCQGAGRLAGLPLASRYPQGSAPCRACAAPTAVSGRGKWNKQLGGSRARERVEAEFKNKPASAPSPPVRGCRSPSPSPRAPSKSLPGPSRPPRRPARPL